MISKKMEKALNEHLNFEILSTYSYAATAAYFDNQDLNGFANWMKVQVQEELAHSVKFYTFINDIGARVRLTAIAAPQQDFDSPLAAFEDALKHEQTVTKRIYKLLDLAREESDHATETFLQWFVNEQVEEEANVTLIIKRLKMVGGDGQGLFLMDRELATRTAGPGGSPAA